MLIIGRIPVFILIMFVAVFFAWDVIFLQNDLIRSLGVGVLLAFAGAVSFNYLIKAYRNLTNQHRNFWLLLSIGVFFNLMSNTVWLFSQVNQQLFILDDVSYTLWFISYIFYLAALIYKTKKLSAAASNIPYVFNIVIFMITAASINLHYLIKPIALSDYSLLITVVTMAYPIASLSIFFVIINLYYLIKDYKNKGFMFTIIVAFFIQLVADAGYAFLTIKGGYYVGSIIDLLWIIALLLIGFAGSQAKEVNAEQVLEIKNPLESRETIFPYVSAMVLLFVVIYSYHGDVNTLSLGLHIIFIIIIGRQLLIVKKNKKLMREYKYLAYHDPLTSLNNRAFFKEFLDQIMEESRQSNSRIALLLIDLDRFKVINDTLGHYIGDTILIKTSKRLKESLGTNVQISRLGGDEFVIIIPDATERQCSLVAETILEKFQKPFLVGDKEISVTPSIGISMFPENGNNGEDLLKNADAAMYLAKERGKNSYRFYNSELNEALMRKMEIENGLRHAIDKNQLSVVYQPKVDLHTGAIIGMEALLRWEHPELGSISPAEFIPIAEETGLIIPIGEWVLQKACKQNKLWQEKGLPPLRVSVNVSVLQFQQGDFVKTVSRTLHETKLDPGYLELEITESIMQNIEQTKEILFGLKEVGVKTAIDDFGTGYSSLHILQKVPIDTIKIDKSFIDDILDFNQRAMVKVIIELGLNLGLDVVAEGIEHDSQQRVLIESKCKIGQGYLFSKPVSQEEFESMLLVES